MWCLLNATIVTVSSWAYSGIINATVGPLKKKKKIKIGPIVAFRSFKKIYTKYKGPIVAFANNAIGQDKVKKKTKKKQNKRGL